MNFRSTKVCIWCRDVSCLLQQLRTLHPLRLPLLPLPSSSAEVMKAEAAVACGGDDSQQFLILAG
jgi:hypothetical protein